MIWLAIPLALGIGGYYLHQKQQKKGPPKPTSPATGETADQIIARAAQAPTSAQAKTIAFTQGKLAPNANNLDKVQKAWSAAHPGQLWS
jgi:uncharacterized protein HemX